MQIGLYANTHGVGYRDDDNNYTRSVPGENLEPVAIAQTAERNGFHSIWFPDHVCMPTETNSAHIANKSGARSYSRDTRCLMVQLLWEQLLLPRQN